MSGLIDTIDNRIKAKVPGNIVSGLVYGLSQASPNTAQVQLQGETQLQTAHYNPGLQVRAGQFALISRDPQSKRYIILSTYGRQSSNGGAISAELSPPSGLSASVGLPGAAFVYWTAPAQSPVVFEVQTNSSASESGATTELITRGSYLVKTGVAAFYVRVRSIDALFQFSSWTSWLNVTPVAGVPGNAKYWVSEANAGLTAEVNLGALTTGLLKHTVSTGVSTPATAVEGTDYFAPGSNLYEYIYDTMAAILTPGSNVTLTEDDPSNTITVNASTGSAFGGHEIYEDATPLAQRDKLVFKPTASIAVTGTDNSGDNATELEFSLIGSGLNVIGSYYEPRTLPASPSSKDDAFDDNSVDVKWVNADPGSVGTVTEDDLGLKIAITNTSGDSLVGLVQAQSSGDFTVEAHFSASYVGVTDYMFWGLALLEGTGATDNWETWGVGSSSFSTRVHVCTWNQYNNINAEPAAADIQRVSNSISLRIRRNGTTYYYDWSNDGSGWALVVTRSSASVGFTPAHVGIFGNVRGANSMAVRCDIYKYAASDVGLLDTIHSQRAAFIEP